MPRPGLPRDGPVPGHTTIARHLGRMSAKWPGWGGVLAGTARMRVGESGRGAGTPAADSTRAGTLRYGRQPGPDRIRHESAGRRARRCLKWHAVAAPDRGTVPVPGITPGSGSDSPVPGTVPGGTRHPGLGCGGPVSCADRGHGSDRTCRMLFGMGMIPDIKQRRPPSGRGSTRRRGAAALFDESAYGYRGLIGGRFRAEETEGHRLPCRSRRRAARYRFGRTRAIGRNPGAPDRVRCSRMPGAVKSVA